MPPEQSEAVVLRVYPVREADLLVTFLTRQKGKIRGVARSAKRSKRRFGGALEPLTHVRLYWEERERHELSRIDACDVLGSPLRDKVDYPRAVGLAYVAELLDELLPDHEPNDAVFRLTLAVLGRLQAGAIWMPLTYFSLWLVRLTGLLPEMHACITCGRGLNGAKAWFHPMADGLMCADHKRLASSEIASDSRELAETMLRRPIEALAADVPWPRERCADLRRFLHQRIERQLEKKLTTATMLDRLDS